MPGSFDFRFPRKSFLSVFYPAWALIAYLMISLCRAYYGFGFLPALLSPQAMAGALPYALFPALGLWMLAMVLILVIHRFFSAGVNGLSLEGNSFRYTGSLGVYVLIMAGGLIAAGLLMVLTYLVLVKILSGLNAPENALITAQAAAGSFFDAFIKAALLFFSLRYCLSKIRFSGASLKFRGSFGRLLGLTAIAYFPVSLGKTFLQEAPFYQNLPLPGWLKGCLLAGLYAALLSPYALLLLRWVFRIQYEEGEAALPVNLKKELPFFLPHALLSGLTRGLWVPFFLVFALKRLAPKFILPSGSLRLEGEISGLLRLLLKESLLSLMTLGLYLPFAYENAVTRIAESLIFRKE